MILRAAIFHPHARGDREGNGDNGQRGDPHAPIEHWRSFDRTKLGGFKSSARRPKIRDGIAHRRVAIVGRLGEARVDQVLEIVSPSTDRFRQARWCVVQDRVHGVDSGSAEEWRQPVSISCSMIPNVKMSLR